MGFDFDYFRVKIIADMLGYLSGWMAWYLSNKLFFKNYFKNSPLRNLEEKVFYYLWILGFAMFFGGFVSTIDYYFVHWAKEGLVLSKTVAWAIAGWVIASEVFKKIYKHNFNTWVLFVPSLVVWIIVWRIGAFLIWLRDNTHWLATSLPWGYDYWDGILRHPAQIYEIIVLFVFWIIFIILLKLKLKWTLRNWFFLFTLVYFTYRLLVWFVMPYSDFWFGLNSIQVVSIWMIIYSFYKLKKYIYAK